MARKLTAKQEKYKNNRIKNMGPSDSYRDAYDAENMSPKAITVAANRLEKHPTIRLAIEQGKEKAQNKAIMTREEALERLTLHARIKITDVCDFKFQEVGQHEDGSPIMQTVWVIKNSEDIDPEVAACIKSVSVGRDGPKIELYDSDGAIKQLSSMQGWDAAKKFENTGVIGVASVSADEYKEARRKMLEDDDC